MKSVKLSRALQIKKRLVEKISKISNDIISENRIVIENERNVDIINLLLERQILVFNLIDLKKKLFEASTSIRHDILRLAELKSESSFLQSIPTEKGKQHRSSLMGEGTVEYDVILTKNDIDQKIKKIEQEIDDIQYNIIDKYNNETYIEIEEE